MGFVVSFGAGPWMSSSQGASRDRGNILRALAAAKGQANRNALGRNDAVTRAILIDDQS